VYTLVLGKNELHNLIGALVLFVSITQMACTRWTRSGQELDLLGAYLANIHKPQACNVPYQTEGH